MSDDDADDINFEVGRRDDGKLWTLAVTCKQGLSEKEFAASMIELGNDILEDKVSFEDADESDCH